MPTDAQIRVNTYLIREKVIANAYTSEIAEQLIAAECPCGAAELVAKLAEANGLSIADALVKFRERGKHHALLEMPGNICRNSWPPVPVCYRPCPGILTPVGHQLGDQTMTLETIIRPFQFQTNVGATVPPLVDQRIVWEELSTADFPPGTTVTTLDEHDLADEGSF
jgi:hypothetical protein